MVNESFRASPLDLPDAPPARAEVVPGTESHLAPSPSETIKVTQAPVLITTVKVEPDFNFNFK